ncbi:recombinase family protein [Castellaniella hirudinis]|uniref:recombinase family protein n=1 Tax=Castellaniella hirudinis TaxID=1144617 RepID=UPI0039C0278B
MAIEAAHDAGTAARIFGYARVSTDEQHLDLQMRALKRADCDPVFVDQGVSGATMRRDGLDQTLRLLRPGDQLVVWRLDRLGRSLSGLIQLLDSLGERQVGFRSLCEHIDIGTPSGKLVFHLMAALAEFERALISERTRAGMAAARVRGQHLGRPPALTPAQRSAACTLLNQGQRLAQVADQFGVSVSTLRRFQRDSAWPLRQTTQAATPER